MTAGISLIPGKTGAHRAPLSCSIQVFPQPETAQVELAGVKDSSGKDQGLLILLLGDGRQLLSLTGVALLVSGCFAIFLAMRREFLPHDVAFLGMNGEQLCRFAGCRIVGFMFHDRVAFGGTLIAVAILYLWLAAGPLREGERWAWWAFAVSGCAGFISFLAYLGYGYLDTWHGDAGAAAGFSHGPPAHVKRCEGSPVQDVRAGSRCLGDPPHGAVLVAGHGGRCYRCRRHDPRCRDDDCVRAAGPSIHGPGSRRAGRHQSPFDSTHRPRPRRVRRWTRRDRNPARVLCLVCAPRPRIPRGDSCSGSGRLWLRNRRALR